MYRWDSQAQLFLLQFWSSDILHPVFPECLWSSLFLQLFLLCMQTRVLECFLKDFCILRILLLALQLRAAKTTIPFCSCIRFIPNQTFFLGQRNLGPLGAAGQKVRSLSMMGDPTWNCGLPFLMQDSDLAERQELLVITLGYIDHQVLRTLWELT